MTERLIGEKKKERVLFVFQIQTFIAIIITYPHVQELGKECVKFLRSSVTLSPFSAALALSLAKVHRFQDKLFEFLKASVLM